MPPRFAVKPGTDFLSPEFLHTCAVVGQRRPCVFVGFGEYEFIFPFAGEGGVPPTFFVTAESKGVRFSVSGLESAVVDDLVTADSKGVTSKHNIPAFCHLEKKNADESSAKLVRAQSYTRSTIHE